MITAIFIVFSSLVLCFSYWLRAKLSGSNFRGRYFAFCVVGNFPFGIFHLEIVSNRCVQFVGCFPDLHFDYPVLSWVAFICVFLHCAAFPVEHEPRRLFRKTRRSL